MTIPRLKPDDAAAYARVKSAAESGAPITIGGKVAKFTGMTGHLLTFRVGRRNVYIRAGDAVLKEIAATLGNNP